VRARLAAFGALALCAALAARADAATYCVEVAAAGCVAKDTAADAFAAARADAERDTILLGRLSGDGPFADARGRPVRVLGLGAEATRLRAGSTGLALRLLDPGSSAAHLRLDGLLQIDAGAELRSAVVDGRVRVRGGTAALSSVVVSGPGPVLQAGCEDATARVALDHVTLTGSGEDGVSAGCGVAGRSIAITAENSIVWGFARAFASGPGAGVAAAYSAYPGATGDTNLAADPLLAGPADARLRPESPLVDAGRPGALGDEESHEDALGFVRAVDGNGDGTPRRDVGALELQPPPPAVAAGNVLSNPGAEAGTAAEDDTSSPAPPAWTRTGAFTFVRYGTVAGPFPFPSRRVGEALGAGDAFFAGGPGTDGSATQVADLHDAAPEIDRGRGTAALSALLGGYRSSGDGAIAEAEFRGPAGGVLGSVRIGPVGAAERAGASTLLPRSVEAAIPPLTRTIAVTLRSTPASGGYDDAYFDAVALVPRMDGAAPHAAPLAVTGRRLRPFAGVALIARRAAVDSRRRVWVRMACPTRTVGRCRGVVTVTARLAARAPERRIASRRFALRPGRARRLPIRLTRAARRAIGERRRLRGGHFYVAVRDGQGVTRTSAGPRGVGRGTGFGGRRGGGG